MALRAINKVSLLVGKCVPCLKQEASKFKVKRLEMDTNLNMYFPKHEYVYAHDPDKICKSGDIVLIEMLPQKLTRLITHKVKEVIYPMGDVTDPLTGKKVVATLLREHRNKIRDFYGKTPTAFDYDKAPARGWQEDKKDFTHRETYIKYHETGEDQPYSV